MSELDFLRLKRQEKAIEDLLFAYPSLIAPDLRFPRRQEVLSSISRTDLAFYFPKRVVVVEIKRGTAGVAALRQLERYLKEYAVKGLKAHGILVAHGFNAACIQAAKDSDWKPRLRQLGRDIPTEVAICEACREPRDCRVLQCPHDGCTSTLRAAW
jgi:RecB family endonuclease NucS